MDEDAQLRSLLAETDRLIEEMEPVPPSDQFTCHVRETMKRLRLALTHGVEEGAFWGRYLEVEPVRRPPVSSWQEPS